MSSVASHVQKLERYASSLGPHGRLLLDELGRAGRSHPPCCATVIILSAAVLDVMLREPSGVSGRADGVDIASARDSKGAYWLRERRNGIVHYEGGRGGLMGEDVEGVLERDAIKSIDVLCEAMEVLV